MNEMSVLIDEAKYLLNELIELIRNTGQSKFCGEEDHYCYMAVHFLGRQISHAQSVLKLIPSRDVMLITRSMIEGWAYLEWASENKNKAKDWQFFAYVYDLREAEKFNIEEKQVELKEILCKPEFKHFQKNGNGYHRTWRLGTQITQIFETISTAYVGKNRNDKAEECKTIKSIYDTNSEWHHWGVKGIVIALEYDDNNGSLVSSFTSLSKREQLSQLELCITVFDRVCVLTSECLNDNEVVQEKYKSISSKYAKWQENLKGQLKVFNSD